MRAPSRLAVPFALALVTGFAGAGCKADSTVFLPPGDGGLETDATPEGIYVVVTPPVTTVAEGGQATVQIRLSEMPEAERTIDVTGSALLTPTPAQLTFTADSWSVSRTVILAAGQDDDAEDSPVFVLFDGHGEVADGTAMVMITDDDLLGLVVTPPASLGVTEGSSGEVQVQLTARPTSNLVVAVSTTNPARATSSPPQLVFTPDTWATPQVLTVLGTDDVDTTDGSTELVLDPEPEGVASRSLTIDVTDNDILAIDAAPSNLGVLTEAAGAGHSAVLGLRLTQMPPGDVTVDLAAAPGDAVTLSPAQVTFTPADYATVHGVTVTASDDDDVVDEQVSIQLSSAGMSDRIVQATIDDDEIQVLQVTPGTVPPLAEGAGTNLGVRLAHRPGGTVLVDVHSDDPGLAAVDLAQLTFTPSTYDVVQLVRVTAVDDANLAGGSATIWFNAAATGLTSSRAVIVTDDDTQALAVTPATLAVAEGGQASFTVRLLFEPAGPVMVTASGGPEVTLAPGTSSFGPGNYDVPQTVMLSGAQDPDTADESVTVTVASAGLASRAVAVDVSDDDTLDLVVTPPSLAVTEGDPTGATLMVSLGAMPAGNVTVNLTTTPPGVADLGATSLTFTPADFATPQAVVVTGTADADAADGSAVIRLASTGLADETVPVTVDDDEVLTAVATPSPITVTEGIANNTLRVRLSHDPGRAITVDVTATAGVGASPATLGFSPTNWNTGQAVTLTAVADDTDDDEVETVTFQIAGAGTSASSVNVDDPTLLVGFPPPHGGAAGEVMTLEAYRADAMPDCWILDKVAVVVAASSSATAKVQVGVYEENGNEPEDRVWESGPLTIGAGAGLRVIDLGDVQLHPQDPGTAWVTIETTAGVTLEHRTATGTSCRRDHGFGGHLPDPFDHGGDPPVCGTSAPVAVWLIGRTAASCN